MTTARFERYNLLLLSFVAEKRGLHFNRETEVDLILHSQFLLTVLCSKILPHE